MENEIEKDDSLNVQDENLNSETEDTEADEVDVEALQEQNKKLFARAKEAEAKLKEKAKVLPKEAPKEEPKEDKERKLSDSDIITLAKANIHDDDLPEVLDYARFKNMTVAQALKSPVIQSTLSTRAEERKTAEATQTRVTKKGAKTDNTADLTRKVLEKGEFPENLSDDDMEKLAEAAVRGNLKK